MSRRTALALRHVAFEDAGVWDETPRARGYDLSYVDIGPQARPRAAVASCDLLIALGAPQ
jgi:GMP synthase (glutamine-hydrolysing)